MSKGAEESHPCYGCPNLFWDYTTLNHGTTVDIPYCQLDLFVATERCDEFPKDKT